MFSIKVFFLVFLLVVITTTCIFQVALMRSDYMVLVESRPGKGMTPMHILYSSVLYFVCQINCLAICLSGHRTTTELN